MLQLVASSTEANGTSLPVRWCISRDTLADLKENRVTNPHILIVVVKKGIGEVTRKLIPLENLMEYLDFNRAGDHTVLSSIVWHKDGDVRKLRVLFMGGRLHGKHYGMPTLLDENDQLLILQSAFEKGGIEFSDEAEITISVAAEHFAKPPWKWEQFWVNLWFERPPRDRCEFRKRRLVAYTIQPFIILPFLFFITALRAIIALYLLSILKRGINFKPIFHPWNYSSIDVWIGGEGCGTLITQDSKHNDRFNKYFLILPFTPLVGIIIFIGACIGNAVWSYEASIPQLIGVSILGQAVISLAFLIIFLIYFACEMIHEYFQPRIRTLLGRIESSRISDVMGPGFVYALPVLTTIMLLFVTVAFGLITYFIGWQAVLMLICAIFFSFVACYIIMRYLVSRSVEQGSTVSPYQEPQGLICENKPLQVNYAALPAEQQTLHLRFKYIKARVCKQFPVGSFS